MASSSPALKLDLHYTRCAEWHRLTARIDGSAVGHIEWAPAGDALMPGEITGLSVVPKYRRQGIATALYNTALAWPGVNPPCHSALRMREGDCRARSVGGYLPRLHGGRYLRATVALTVPRSSGTRTPGLAGG
jgi:GNAT superfamily N-acetyltransferase